MCLSQNKGYKYAVLVAITNIIFTSGQVAQNSWLAANVQNPSLLAVDLNIQTSRSLFSQLLCALFGAPMSFFHSTPLGRIIARVSSDLSIVDLDVPLTLSFSISATLIAYINLGILCYFTWQVLFVAAPLIFMSVGLQKYYLASSNELMRINGTTKSLVANHLGESISGAVIIRAFKKENRFFAKMLELIDNNASTSFYCFAATEWLTQGLEIMAAAILSSSAFAFTILPLGTYSSAQNNCNSVVGMVLSYGLSLNMFTFLYTKPVFSCKSNNLCRNLSQYIHIVSEERDIIEDNQLPDDWPSVKYNQDAPPVLQRITCTFQGGDKIGIVGRTGSGKTTLINAIFRLIEPSGGNIIIDGQDITTVGYMTCDLKLVLFLKILHSFMVQ
ncbi:hypothetical protein ACP4OV_027960 [Aristida adscensionis]